MTKLESSVKVIPYSQERVFNKLSDLNNLEKIKEKIPSDRVQDLSFDADTMNVNIPPAGNLSLKVVEREPNKCIKFEAVTSPVPFSLWIQIAPGAGEEESKIKLTIGLDINPFMMGMVKRPLADGLEKMAEMIATIKY